VEGSTPDPAVTAPRRRQVRLPLTLVLSRGVPILQAGDEFRHTQLGNNNAYCQDNQLTWLADVTRRLLRLRADEPVFRRGHFSQGRPLLGGDVTEFRLLHPTGRETREEDWTTPVQTLGVLSVGEEIGERERTVIGNSYLALLNAADTRVDFELPPRLTALDIDVVLRTASSELDNQQVKDAFDLPPLGGGPAGQQSRGGLTDPSGPTGPVRRPPRTGPRTPGGPGPSLRTRPARRRPADERLAAVPRGATPAGRPPARRRRRAAASQMSRLNAGIRRAGCTTRCRPRRVIGLLGA
jgi:hypothetical protein